jgi:cell division protein FtsW (lipid II flippase)
MMDPSIYRLRQRDILAFCVLALLCLGVVMVQSASMHVTGKLGWYWSALGLKQLGFA